jgi:hypothetical protein
MKRNFHINKMNSTNNIFDITSSTNISKPFNHTLFMSNTNLSNDNISLFLNNDIEKKGKKLEKIKEKLRINIKSADRINNDDINKKEKKYKFPELGPLKRKNSFIPFTKIKSPFSIQSREMFLYKKIFYFFSEKKKKYTKDIKLINNKLNLEYAENEEQFDKRLIKHNFNLLKKGEKIKHFSGPTFSEIKLNELQNKVKFIKSVTDYSYPDMVLFKVQQSEKMLKIKNKNYKILEPFKQKDLQNQIQQKYLKDYLNDAIVIQKV